MACFPVVTVTKSTADRSQLKKLMGKPSSASDVVITPAVGRTAGRRGNRACETFTFCNDPAALPQVVKHRFLENSQHSLRKPCVPVTAWSSGLWARRHGRSSKHLDLALKLHLSTLLL
jgi:hypothetical protein